MAELKGFWSYAHADDDADGGRVQRLARDVAAQYEMLTGEKIDLFLDSDDISWGEEWRKRIDESLSSIAFFIAVLTPRYFLSSECRRELQKFARSARDLGIEELVLPLRYVDVPSLQEDEPSDDLVALVRTFQWCDWRELRFSDVDSSEYRRGVASLAQRLVEANKKAAEADAAAATRELVPSEGDEDDLPGVLDQLAAAEETLPQLQTTLEGIVEEIQLITQIVQEAAEEMGRVDAQGKGFAARLTVARKVSQRLREPAERVWSFGNEFASQLYQIDPGFRVLIEQASREVRESPEYRPQVCVFFSEVRELSAAAQEGLASMQDMIGAISPVESMSRDMRKPLKRLRQGLTLVVEARKVTDGWVDLIEGTGIDCDDVSTKSVAQHPEGRKREARDLDAGSIGGNKNMTMDSGMEKHTISVGTDQYGETVAFTANKLGTAEVNGGNGGGGMDLTVYRLPDNTYRVLAEREGISLLEPSNFVQVFGTDQPAEYGRWTYEEAAADETYGEMFTKFMVQHPEGRKREVRDLD